MGVRARQRESSIPFEEKARKWLKKRGFEVVIGSLGSRQAKEDISGPGIFRNERGERSLSGRELVRVWREPISGLIGVGIVTLFWNSIVGFMSYMLFVKGSTIQVNGTPYSNIYEAFEGDPFIVAFLIFPIIGLGFLWSTLAMALNSTRYIVANTKFIVKHGPIPSLRGLCIPRSHPAQFYVVRKISRSKNGSTTYYKVLMRDNIGSDTDLGGRFSRYADAKRLEQWLESRLGLSDQSIKGEVGT